MVKVWCELYDTLIANFLLDVTMENENRSISGKDMDKS